MAIEIRPVPAERGAELLAPISVAFGLTILPERVARTAALPELQTRLGAYDDDTLVGACGAYHFAMTVPGGAAVDTAGVTLVAVLPTHRRRGILRGLMRRQLDDAHARGQSVAALWASEASIYGRFGYGMAALAAEAEIDARHAHFAHPAPPIGRLRLVREVESFTAFPPVWDRVRARTPGMPSRSDAWWRARRLADPDAIRDGRGPLQRLVLEVDGLPVGYALYRFAAPMGPGSHEIVVSIHEVLADSPEATRTLWRYLLDLDLVTVVRAASLPVDHPLLFLVTEPRRLHLRVADGMWVRLVDVPAALSQRAYGPGGALVLEVEDAFCPWNHGRYRLADGVATRTEEAADVTLGVDALATAYLGAFSFTQLAQAGRVVERKAGALARADGLFRGERAPWCPEIF